MVDPEAQSPTAKKNHTPKFCLFVDVEMTRRKRWHFVTNADGTVVFSASWLSDCLIFLDAQEAPSFRVVAGDRVFDLVFRHPITTRPPNLRSTIDLPDNLRET